VISVREAARLHGLPDWFAVHRVKWHGLRQIGNSVPPPLARAVAEQLVEALGRSPGSSHEAIGLGDNRLRALSLRDAAGRYNAPRELLPVDVRRDTKRVPRPS
jgi:DNA (cytosine-5)-methyltransferase 1